MRKATLLGAAIAASAMVSAACAEEVLPASRSMSGTRIAFALPSGYFNATLSVAGPDGRVVTVFSKSGPPTLDIGGQNAMGDGLYTYQLTAASPKTKAVKATDGDGRDVAAARVNMRGERMVQVGAAMSGTFRVQGGRIVDTSGLKEEPAR